MGRVGLTFWVAASAACTSWRVEEVSPAQLISEDNPSHLRVTLKDGSRVEMEHPETVGDTLVSRIQDPLPSGSGSSTERIPFSYVARIETKHTSPGKTAGLVVGLTALAAIIAGGVAIATWDGPFGGCCQ